MGHLWREGSVRGVDWDGCDPPSGGMLEPLAGMRAVGGVPVEVWMPAKGW
jgi:hypothetical protein